MGVALRRLGCEVASEALPFVEGTLTLLPVMRIKNPRARSRFEAGGIDYKSDESQNKKRENPGI